MTRVDVIEHIALVFAKRINPQATCGNSMDREYAELAVEAMESSGVTILAPLPAVEVAERETQHCYVEVETLIRVYDDLYPAGEKIGPTVYVPLESG